MGVSPYILNQLFANGIIEYVPDLGQGPMGAMTGMQNPYMDMAMSGRSYQYYGYGSDSFSMTGRPAIYNQAIGTNSQAGNNMFGLQGVGAQTNTGISNLYGQAGIGNQTNTGVSNLYGQDGIGNSTNTGFSSMFGGFNDIRGKFNSAVANVSGAPDIVKGLAALGIIIGTFYALKGKKKPKVQKQGFFSRLNPFKKKALPAPEKKSFFSKINPLKMGKKVKG